MNGRVICRRARLWYRQPVPKHADNDRANPLAGAGATGGASGSLESRRAGALKGSARVPGDKSISHRALMIGALAVGLLGMLPYGGIAPLAALVLWTFLVGTTWASIMLYRRLQTSSIPA